DDALARRVIHHALPAHGVRNRSALGGVLSFGFDRDRVAAEDVEFALGKRLLIKLAAFSRWRDWIEHARIGNARLCVVGNQLVSIHSDADSRKWRPTLHDTSPRRDGRTTAAAPAAASRWAGARQQA